MDTPTPTPDPTVTSVPATVVHVAVLSPDQWWVVCLFMGLVVFTLGLMAVAAWTRH